LGYAVLCVVLIVFKAVTNRADRRGRRKSSAHLTGVVSRIVTHPDATWAEIVIEGADNLYREVRVPHPLQNEDGTTTTLKAGDRVKLAVSLADSVRPPQTHLAAL